MEVGYWVQMIGPKVGEIVFYGEGHSVYPAIIRHVVERGGLSPVLDLTVFTENGERRVGSVAYGSNSCQWNLGEKEPPAETPAKDEHRDYARKLLLDAVLAAVQAFRHELPDSELCPAIMTEEVRKRLVKIEDVLKKSMGQIPRV
jgi:hypothetical protein